MEKILVVDDEPDIRFLIKKILEKEGYAVLEAEGGEDALELIKNVVPDLILLDVMMPGLDGWETCKRIKTQKSTKNIVVTMLTAKTADDDKIQALESFKADWHISKPINTKTLLDTVEWLLKTPPRRDA